MHRLLPAFRNNSLDLILSSTKDSRRKRRCSLFISCSMPISSLYTVKKFTVWNSLPLVVWSISDILSSSQESRTCWSLFCSSDFAASSSSMCFVASSDIVGLWPFCNWTSHQQRSNHIIKIFRMNISVHYMCVPCHHLRFCPRHN